MTIILKSLLKIEASEIVPQKVFQALKHSESLKAYSDLIKAKKN